VLVCTGHNADVVSAGNVCWLAGYGECEAGVASAGNVRWLGGYGECEDALQMRNELGSGRLVKISFCYCVI